MKLIEKLSTDLKDYQSIPFWSWNDNLDIEELKRQIRVMKEQGIGGFFMHARGGLETPYLGEKWFECTKACMDEAEKLGMNAWSYDENGWPSGFAGMKLLEDASNFAHYVEFIEKPKFDSSALCVFVKEGENFRRVTKGEGEAVYINIYDRTNSSVVDILNPAIVRKFIDETHEKYFERFGKDFGKSLLGFFTDEPQYFRWNTAYTPCLIEKFHTLYGEDIRNNLIYLRYNHKDAPAFRYKYWLNMHRLFIDNFVKQIYEWCNAHHCQLTGHAVEEGRLFTQMWACAGIMEFYEYEHIPGIDWLGRNISDEIAPKQLGSACQQLGKTQAISETFGCSGWDVTPKELKRIAEFQYVHGVNLMCQHLMSYSIRGQRKRDYPVSFSEHTPWYGKFKVFNDYFTSLGYLLSSGKDVVSTCVLHPIRSAYIVYDRFEDYKSTKELDDDFAKTAEKLGKLHIEHHFLDESLFEKHGKVQDGKIIMGNCVYTAIVLPTLYTMGSFTKTALQEFVKQGGKIYVDGKLPASVEGVPFDFSFLKTNITLDELAKEQEIEIKDKDTEIRSTLKDSEFGRYLYAVNLSDSKTTSTEFTLKGKGIKEFDVAKKVFKPCYFEKTSSGVTLPVTFEPMQSYVFFLDDEAQPIEEKPKQKAVFSVISSDFKIVERTENSLTLDKASLSFDGKTYEQPLYILGIFDRLIQDRKNREIYLKYTFESKFLPKNLSVEIEQMSVVDITVNGTRIQPKVGGIIDNSFLRAEISKLVKTGCNEIIAHCNFYQDEHVYKVCVDNADGTESLKNCLSFNTELESIYLRGDFGVFSDFTLQEKGNLTADSFFIDKAKQNICAENLVKEGYAFFAGNMTLEKEIEVTDTDLTVELSGRFSLAEITVNDVFVDTLMLTYACDLSKHLKKGKNKLSIKLYSSNRNLLGPHHNTELEPVAVGPYSFSAEGCWKNGKCGNYRDNYSFVPFGLSTIHLKK